MSSEPRPLSFRGAFVLSGVRHEDSRGDFKRVLDLDLLPGAGRDPASTYLATALNRRRGTIRGLHYQEPPYEEAKTVWCTSGAIFDVLVDLRPDEPTFGQWISVDLHADDVTALHVPPGIAHGYQTIEDETVVSYLISGTYEPRSARTISWSDKTLAIDWPLQVSEISEQDEGAPPWPTR
ncbi:dTDP-4-dehydrorhamnose 3,5-epimerase [Marmoricola sp. URHA0025 HA25]